MGPWGALSSEKGLEQKAAEERGTCLFYAIMGWFGLGGT